MNTKELIILIAQVEYPAGGNSFLTANSYVLEQGDMKQLDEEIKSFRDMVETGGFKILNMLLHVVEPQRLEQLK